VTLEESGADGLVPIGSLPGDYYHYEEAQHRLVGRRSRRVYRLGDPITVRLAEANQVTGGLIFKIIEEGRAKGDGKEPSHDRPRQSQRRADKERSGKTGGARRR
jgi:ribonuclease R